MRLRHLLHGAAALGLVTAAPTLAKDQPTGNAPPPQDTEAAPAPVQQPGAGARQVYTPADFTRYAPRTALDMIEEIPGFQVQQNGGGGNGGGGGRGFGQASENLLINGERISSKSSSAADQLARIPADNVIRIEVVDGATLDIPGLSGRVANIVIERGGMQGQFEWTPQVSTGPANPAWASGKVSVSGSTGPVNFTIALENPTFVRGSEGPAIFTDARGNADRRVNRSVADFDRPELSGNFAFAVAEGVVANLNLSGGLQIFRSREDEDRVAGNPLPAFAERIRTRNDEWFYELGGDITFPLGPGRLKLIVLEGFEHSDFVTSSLLDVGTAPTQGTRFARLQDEGERIGRGEYSWGMWGAEWQLSGEAAFNRLDQVARLFGYDDTADGFAEIPFPSGVGGVREDRYEGLLSLGFSLAPTLSVQLVGGAEQSTIAQTGSNALSRSFLRPKGSVGLAWRASPRTNVGLRVAREVGQLDFGDFLASVNLSEDNQNAGNNELRPQQAWNTVLEVAHDFGAFGQATLELFDERISDLVVYVPVAGGLEARGNIASARRYGARWRGTLELEALGFRGAQLDMRGFIEQSRLTDPVGGFIRRFDRNPSFEARFDFRHDVPDTDFAWGLELRHTEDEPTFRVAEIVLDHNPATFGAAFIEHKDLLGLTARLRVGNLFDQDTVTLREVYAGRRDTAPLLFTEDRQRSIGQVFNLTVSGSF